MPKQGSPNEKSKLNASSFPTAPHLAVKPGTPAIPFADPNDSKPSKAPTLDFNEQKPLPLANSEGNTEPALALTPAEHLARSVWAQSFERTSESGANESVSC
jgi:hypothetical protein